jgi:hypothetical protein
MQKHRVMGAVVCTGVVLGALALGTFHAHAATGRAVFVIALENHNWVQPVHKFDGGSGLNAFNGKNQYNYAGKHAPQMFFTDTNGGNDLSNANQLRLNNTAQSLQDQCSEF